MVDELYNGVGSDWGALCGEGTMSEVVQVKTGVLKFFFQLPYVLSKGSQDSGSILTVSSRLLLHTRYKSQHEKNPPQNFICHQEKN